MDLRVIPTEQVEREDINLASLRDKPKKKQAELVADKIELSKNIQKFDKKPRVITVNPYAYNSISLKKNRVDVAPTQTAEQMITSPVYNTIGKFLGVDTIHDWNKYYDKVFTITQWAKEGSQTEDLGKLIQWINGKSKRLPNVSGKSIDSLYLFARLSLSKK